MITYSNDEKGEKEKNDSLRMETRWEETVVSFRTGDGDCVRAGAWTGPGGEAREKKKEKIYFLFFFILPISSFFIFWRIACEFSLFTIDNVLTAFSTDESRRETS